MKIVENLLKSAQILYTCLYKENKQFSENFKILPVIPEILRMSRPVIRSKPCTMDANRAAGQTESHGKPSYRSHNPQMVG